MVRPRAKVTIESLQEVVYEKSICTKMNDLDLCLEVISRSRQPLRYSLRWIFRKPLKIQPTGYRLDSKGPPIGNGILATEWSRDRW